MVSVKQEADFAINLIEINKIKTSPLFDVRVKMKFNENDSMLTQKLLAPLISVELIENAFKHADIQQRDSFISVVFEFAEGDFKLTVANKISKKAALKKDHSGVGMEILRQRLKILYEDFYSLECFIEEDVYISHLKLDLLGYKAKMLNIG
jgi:LytS/YehU family sensor histidine kinase